VGFVRGACGRLYPDVKSNPASFLSGVGELTGECMLLPPVLFEYCLWGGARALP
jgi:hypothetical protein